MSLFDKTRMDRNDCSGDYNRSFIYMLIAQFNYFICPFIILCILNLLIILNIWKRSRRMRDFRSCRLADNSIHRTYNMLPRIYNKTMKCLPVEKSCQSKIVDEENNLSVVDSFELKSRQILREEGKSSANYLESGRYLAHFTDQYSLLVPFQHRTTKQTNDIDISPKT